jgi:hypothetical protein
MEWSKIPEYPEHYEINREGEVRTLRWYGKEGQIKILKRTFQVYWFVTLYNLKHIPQPVPVHRLLALAFVPREEGKNYVDHINRDKTDNRIENLRWTTQTDNCINRPHRSATPHIYTDGRAGGFQVRIFRSKKQVFLKTCRTLEEAEQVRDEFLSK